MDDLRTTGSEAGTDLQSHADSHSPHSATDDLPVKLDDSSDVHLIDSDGDQIPDRMVDDTTTPSHTGTPAEHQALIDKYQRAHDHAPEWVKPLIKGRIFNVEQWHRFEANEIYLDTPDGKRVIADSMHPGDTIVSRKDTVLGNVQPSTARTYINEFVQKYNPDKQITVAKTPTNEANPALRDMIGQNIRGTKELEIPTANRNTPIPQEILDYARSHDIDIVDVDGRRYN